MDVKILAKTDVSPSVAIGKDMDLKTQYNAFGGTAGGMCYWPSTKPTEELLGQTNEKKISRAEMMKDSGHHSVFQHAWVSLLLEDVPKLFAMLLNNEKVYNTSERSGRYTEISSTGKENLLYYKWVEKFKNEIAKKYGNEQYFDEKRVKKIAMENARYLLSVYSPTSLVYTTSYCQLNYIYNWLKDLKNSDNPLLKKLSPNADDFCRALEEYGLIYEGLRDNKNRKFSLIADRDREEIYGDAYCTKYDGSFVGLAQLQRHRTLKYEMKQKPKQTFYVPKIIENNEMLRSEWILDMESIKEKTPQGEIVEIIERGTPEDFIMKTKERLCTCAQLEVAEITKNTLKKYINNVSNPDLKKYLMEYDKGARCTFPDFKCTTPCHFKEGITLDRTV